MNPLAEIILKVSLILLAAILIAIALRTRSAALRHWVLSVGVVSCIHDAAAHADCAPAWCCPFRLVADRPAQPVPLPSPRMSVVTSSRSISRPPVNTGATIRSARPRSGVARVDLAGRNDRRVDGAVRWSDTGCPGFARAPVTCATRCGSHRPGRLHDR